MSKLLLKNGHIIDEQGVVHRNTDLFIVDGRIAEVGQLTKGSDCEVWDCAGCYITPGFAVLHAHSAMSILRGLAEDVNIDDWFNERIFPYESKLLDEDIYWGARLCAAEMLQNGVTCFADHYFGAENIANAAIDSGIKCDIAVTAFAQRGVERDITETRRLLRKYSDSRTIRVRFGPHSPYLCSPGALRALVDAARESGVGIHMHISETAQQVAQSLEQRGRTPFAVCADTGCFSLPCIVAHGLYIEEQELRLLGSNTYIAACPKTYMKLGMGEGNLWKLAGQLNLCIGTDGAASSNTVDALEQTRLFGLLGKWRNNAKGFTTAQLWRILMNGHRALDFNSGRIEVGAAADLNIWDLNTPATAPAYDPLAAIIYSASPAVNIRHTLVDGRFVKRDGRLVQQLDEVMENVARCASGILERGKGKAGVSF